MAQFEHTDDEVFDLFIQWPQQTPESGSKLLHTEEATTQNARQADELASSGTCAILAVDGPSFSELLSCDDPENLALGYDRHPSSQHKRRRSAVLSDTSIEYLPSGLSEGPSDFRVLLDMPPGNAMPKPPPKLRRLMAKPSERTEADTKAIPIGEGFVNTFILPQGELSVPTLRKTRGSFDDDEKQVHKQVRAAGGSCTFCWIMQVRCGPDAQCHECQKRYIPADLCYRERVRNISMYKHRGLARTFVEAYDSSIEKWHTDKIAIKVWHGFGPKIELIVRQYQPKKDIIDLFWKEPTGWQKLAHTPYGMRDTKNVRYNDFDQYAFRQTPGILRKLQEDNFSARTPFINTMQTALQYLEDNSTATTDRKLLVTALQLWSYTFLQYHGLWHFVEAEDTTGKLGMTKLVLDAHDAQTFTAFNGTVPLPRLLHQQIHMYVEWRLEKLEQMVLKDLDANFKAFKEKRGRLSSDELARHALGLYLTSWVYMSVLEEVEWDARRWILRLPRFEWRAEQHPLEAIQKSRHVAETIAANYQIALDTQNIWQMNATRKGKKGGDSNSEKGRGVHAVLRDIRPDELDLITRKDAEFEANDIRCLEMKYSTMLIA